MSPCPSTFKSRYLTLLFSLWMVLIYAQSASAQSITSGQVSGSVSDPTGAFVPNAAITLTNTGTNLSQKTVTNGAGTFQFAFVQPGTYNLSASASGFAPQQRTGVVVTPGQPVAADFRLQVATESTTVQVVESGTVLQTENADVSTHIGREQIANMPNPGGDMTYFAQIAPGVVMNTQSGYGNFEAGGMPATSNLFTVNGVSYNDPFLGINNSGASNLLLGSNDISETNVMPNAYSGQFGQYAGTQVTYVTKSGDNTFHGDALYNWNGRAVNANQFFANSSGLPTPFNNFNQWAANVSGPIVKNRTFFDVNYEGLRNLLPTAANLNLIPSPQFQSATLANLGSVGHADEIPFYQKLFAIYNNAPGASAAVASPGGGCQGFTGLAAGVPCALQFRNTPTNLNREYQWSARVDHNISSNDRFTVRVLRDNGYQPTYTSPFGSTFNDQSNQPQMTGQISETHVFGPNTVNEFKASTLFYAAVFVPSQPSAALAALPTYMMFAGDAFSPAGAWEDNGFPFPQGRRVWQYQVIDDLSHTWRQHTLRVGISWLHDTVTDLDFQGLAGPLNGTVTTNLSDFFAGGGAGTSLNQAFPSSPEESLRINTLGGYIADDWKASNRLTISLNLRLEHYSNPTCDANCFSRLATTFTGAPSAAAASLPYNQLVLSGQKNAYANTQVVVWEPRVGIAWKPFANDRTVVRAGGGVFADQLTGGLAENAAFNSPGLNAFTISEPNSNIAPGVPGSLFTTVAQANQALISQFKTGGSFNSISAAIPGFAAPNFVNFPSTFYAPTYYRWNFEIQQSLGAKMVLSVNYSGMHGEHIPVADEGLNAYCPITVCTNGFQGLPAAPPNAALGQVTQYLSAGNSNYNGLIISLQRRLSTDFSFSVNYTWSHALDDVSNGGIANSQFGVPGLVTDPSLTVPQNPFNIRGNYASADYDVRNYFSATMLLNDVIRHAGMRWGPKAVFGGWTLSSNWFFRTGMPFTIVDGSASDALAGYNYGFPAGETPFFATAVGRVPSACTSQVNTPCTTPALFATAAANTASGAPSSFGTIGRNTVYGPHFFDVDISVMKSVPLGEHASFSFGAQAFNAFNHANFDQPVNDVSNPNFGLSTAAVGPPTSLLGSFVGAGSSPRFLELKGAIRF